jgi:hypothetical protein
MSIATICYRNLIIRAVLGSQPAMLGREADPEALDRLCLHLADCEDANATLRAKGYGKAGQTIAEAVRTVPSVAPS